MNDQTTVIVALSVLVLYLLWESGRFNAYLKPEHRSQSAATVPQVAAHRGQSGCSGGSNVVSPPYADIELYVASWCGHCQAFKPEISILIQQCEQRGLHLRLVDADAADAQSFMASRGVEGFPTIFVKGTKFEGERTADAILAQC